MAGNIKNGSIPPPVYLGIILIYSMSSSRNIGNTIGFAKPSNAMPEDGYIKATKLFGAEEIASNEWVDSRQFHTASRVLMAPLAQCIVYPARLGIGQNQFIKHNST